MRTHTHREKSHQRNLIALILCLADVFRLNTLSVAIAFFVRGFFAVNCVFGETMDHSNTPSQRQQKQNKPRRHFKHRKSVAGRCRMLPFSVSIRCPRSLFHNFIPFDKSDGICHLSQFEGKTTH